ncbi:MULTISPECIES: archaea-specific SMC-related protein [unclassified Haloarcula]|uniref:archaea-specific SMC-related protein n=1 Tax=unclassified Haloarcula TaxID=2624677 RepID=UPI000EF1DF99|nr:MULTISPECIES: archaea-specific SMC-related protein [unclassified Haloarcula]RLM39795.1 chromosome segregation protein SMC [Haloarcula sp. Atlit-120R]RLM47769.1 chromosome segregation protein SMC [Haloarcula sp. Atlit-47R]
MPESKQGSSVAHFDVTNIGGIDETAVDIPPGVTVLTGKNATNRTSFLQSIMAAMGSTQATLKGDADEGSVALTYGDEVYERTLTRAGDAVQFDGESYLDDPSVADLFAFLLETNEARRSVARGDDLREIIMRPVDIDAIRSEVEQLEAEKGEINDELATVESRQRDLPDLEQRRTELREQIEEKREKLAEREEEIDNSSRDIEESRQEQDVLEEKLDELRSTRSDLESVRRDIEAQEESISSLKRERADLEDELEELPETPMGDQQHLEDEIASLRDQRQRLNSEISDLQSLIQYNEERLEEEDYDVIQSLEDAPEGSGGAVTEQLLESEDEESVVCWTCGSTVDREQIEDTVDRLQDLRRQKVEDLNDIKSELDDLKTDQREAEKKQRRRENVERKIQETETEIERREEQVSSLKDRREELTEDVESLEDEVDNLESEDFDEILALHREANQLEFEIDSLESDLDDVSAEIEEIEELVNRADDLREERDALVEELTDKRTKIDQIEANAVDQFNEHMDAILGILEYENLERIWIERIEQTVREGRQKVDRTVFELHIVRTTENGAAYEDTIEHLSESEREVTGLIFALAGYLVHDLHESVPFMLLDSLEAIDSARIAELVEYFADYAEHLVVALLPEDAQALDDDFNRITSI